MDSKDVISKSVLYRGGIIHLCTQLEIVLNNYIAEYFCGDNEQKISDMSLLFLGDERVTLNNKAQIFQFIATNHDVQWYNSYSSIKNKMNKDLVDIIQERNNFAHRVVDDNACDINKIVLLRIKNKVEVLEYTHERFTEICETIKKLIAHFLLKPERLPT